MALAAARYVVYAINPRQVARYQGRHGTSGAKSDKADPHTLSDMARTDGHQLRPVAGDSAEAEAIKVAARTHQTLTWDHTRQVQRLREYFPAAPEGFEDLAAPDILELLAKARPGIGCPADPRPDHRRAHPRPQPERPGQDRRHRRRATYRAAAPAAAD
jgi:hypothetical protein